MKKNALNFIALVLFFSACGGAAQNSQDQNSKSRDTGSQISHIPAPITNGYSIFDNFAASGYMGDTGNIIVSGNYSDKGRPDGLCTKITYKAGSQGYGGVYWQYPSNNWCKQKGRNLSDMGFSKITFYVKGDKGGEEVRFKTGQDCGDSFMSDEIVVHLTKAWQKGSISVAGKDLSNITGAFAWIVGANAQSSDVVTFYLDDVQYEK